MATAVKRQRDSMGRFLPKGSTKQRIPRARDSRGRFLPANGTNSKNTPRRKRRRKANQNQNKAIANQVTHIAIVLDNSGSMSMHQKRARQAYDQMCEAIREQAKRTKQDVRVSYYTFGQGVQRKYFNQNVDSLGSIRYYPNEPRTALYQAIRDVSNDFASLPDANDENVSFLVQIITDGGENVFNVSQQVLKTLIRQNQETDRWTYAVSCPEMNVSRIERDLGIFGGNVSGWDTHSHDGMTVVGHSHSIGVTRYLQTRATGQRATKKFFAEVNVGRQNVNQVQRGLIAEDKNRFRILTVDKARKIKEFIESKNLLFEKGRVFYQLNKPEIVQSYKEIILQKRSDPKVFYGGPQVRQKLGIPEGQEGRVSPGNLGEWVVWIQSTSVNRNLLAKMKLLYDQRPTIAPVPYRQY